MLCLWSRAHGTHKIIIFKLEGMVAIVSLPKSSSYHYPFFLRALVLIYALNPRTTSNESAQKVLSSHLLAHCAPPSQSRDCIGQDINAAICVGNPKNSGLRQIDISLFLYVGAHADTSALACEVISSPAFFPLLCCCSHRGAAFVCVGRDGALSHSQFTGSKD